MKTTALLVIDVQRGAFDGVRCPAIDRASNLVMHATLLVEAARAGHAPIVFVQHCAAVNRALEEGTVHGEFHEKVMPHAADHVVKKHASSAFENTELEQMLRALNISALVVCGLQSELCVFNTSVSAIDLGYVVRIAEDGHSTWPAHGKSSEAISSEVNAELHLRGAVIEPSAVLVSRLGRLD
jgi:nicotinamidase-related amidase